MSIADLRRDYTQHGLSEADLYSDPILQFERWFNQALKADLPEPNAMTLATVGEDGQPSARVVLLKGLDQRGFTFFTNYHSRKGFELRTQPRAALVFFWPELERQVRVEGRVEQCSADEADSYFASRPRGSRLGAWASPQSEVIGGREVLERRLAEVRMQFRDDDVPRPEHWGGYRVVPERIEFWQGRPNRLHDRLRYRRDESGRWIVERLAP